MVGVADITGDVAFHAFRTAPQRAINPATDDLGTLGGSRSYATAINELGQVVGAPCSHWRPVLLLPVDFQGALLANLLEQLDKTHKFSLLASREQPSGAPTPALRLTGVITEFKRGSRAKRYFIGYGSGETLLTNVPYSAVSSFLSANQYFDVVGDLAADGTVRGMSLGIASFAVIALLASFGIPALADVVSVSPDHLDFGNTVVTTSTVQTVVLVNPTKKVVNMFSITATGDFSSPGNTCGTTVLPGDSCTINVQFAPAAAGTRTGVLSVNDDANTTPQKVKLSGTGVPVQLLSIVVSPGNPSIPLGRTQQFTATGNWNNGTSQDLTASAVWTSSATGVAAVSASGLASSVGQGATSITAASGSSSGSTTLTVTAPVLVSITVSPANPSIFVGGARQFTATGTLSDGTTGDLTASADWSSSVQSVASISSTGLATGLSLGLTDVSAAAGSITGSTTLEVCGQFAAVNGATSPRWLHTATLLNDGRVLLAGGLGTTSLSSGSVATSERYNPATRTFSSSGTMAVARAQHTATLLNNGKVLVAGGGTASAELYDPATGTFTTTGSMMVARTAHTATLLSNGQVLIAGGNGSVSAELYDPAAALFTPTGDMAALRYAHTATLLNDGRVLLTGGNGVGGALASAELYDPGAGAFTGTGAMTSGRDGHTATLLTNGEVLVAGGEDMTGPLSTAAKYDPVSGTFVATGSMDAGHTIAARFGHTATLLSTGEVLMASGFGNPTAETYQPRTLTPPGLTSITVAPGNASIGVGSTQKFSAVGLFADGSSQPLASVFWACSDPTVAGISNDAGSQGIAIGTRAGVVMITASAGSIRASAMLTVQ